MNHYLKKKIKNWTISTVIGVVTSTVGLVILISAIFIILIAGIGGAKQDDCESYGSATEGAVNVETSEDMEKNAKTIYDFLRSEFKATPEGAAGALGCMQFESQFNPKAENPSSGAYGIAQWLGPRKTRLGQIAAEQGKDIGDLGVQLTLLKEELNDPYYKRVHEGLRLNNVEEAQKCWLLWFEGLSQDSSQWHLPERNMFAKNWYAKFGGSSVDSDIISNATDAGDTNRESLSCGEGSDYDAETNQEGWCSPVKNFRGGFDSDQDFGSCGSFRPNGWHDGLDYGSVGFSGDKNLYAVHDGKIKEIKYLPQYELGWYVVLDVGDREVAYQEFSNNRSDIKVNVGDTVKAGQPIAQLDSKGGSGGVGTHLHIGVTKKGGNAMEGLNHSFVNDGYWENPLNFWGKN